MKGPATYVKGFGCRPIRDLSAGTEGRRPKASREGTREGRRVATYDDLTAGLLARAMRWSAEQRVADPYGEESKSTAAFDKAISA